MSFYLLWHIWKARNNLLFNNQAIDGRRIFEEAINMKEKTDAVNRGFPTISQPTASLHSSGCWIPPTGNTLKINFDGAYLEGKMSGCAILRDGHGKFLFALSKSVDGGSPIESEALGIHLSLEICRRQQLQDVIIEGDCKPLIDSINDFDTFPLWRARHFIEDARMAKKSSSNLLFVYINRAANICAHNLATHALLYNVSNLICFYNEIPPCISIHVLQDMDNISS
ncbi:catalase isozyme 1 [Iris pallida]|uniref:Catalase isozyme 1 n=1 Tax=Iris pallida TaxID=29817 RepID=A0AAX6GLY2_IRIPA|nr:catalase isozyme 1 [Iris pallida]